MNVRQVTSCQDCPFCNNDYEYGYNFCNLDDNIVMKGMDQMPHDKVHDKCPLKMGSITIEINLNSQEK